jgi:predicted PurR-regulated permease PerM
VPADPVDSTDRAPSAPARAAEPIPPVRPAAGQVPGLVPMPLKVVSELSARFLVVVAAAAVLIWLLVQLRVVVIPVALALLFAALLAPAVAAGVTRLRIPRGPAVGVVLVGGMAGFGLVMSFVVTAFANGLPQLVDQLVRSYQVTVRPLLAGPPLRIPQARLDDLTGEIQRSITGNIDVITSGALSTAATVGEVASGGLLLLFTLIFFLYDGGRIWRFVLRVVPAPQRRGVDTAGRRAFATLVGYTRATVTVAFVDALGIALGLWLVGTPLGVNSAALVLLGAFVPVVGAVLTGSVAVLVALVANGLVPAVVVLAIGVAVMQLEGHVLQPLLLGRAVSLHPLAVVLGVAAGLVVAGIAGALLIVPLIAVVTSGVRSLLATPETGPEEVDPLDPTHGRPGTPAPPRPRRLLTTLATGMVRRRRTDGHGGGGRGRGESRGGVGSPRG